MKNKHILFGICGSFCNHQAILKQLKKLCMDNDVQVIVSENVYTCDTRFFKHDEFLKTLETISTHKVWHTIIEAEAIGPSNQQDIMVIAPMSATVAAKLANGIYDHPITLAAKAMLRNGKNIVFGIATNDGLGISGVNIMKLLSFKQFFAIPFRQDAPFQKERSVVAKWELLEESLDQALINKQLQPLLLGSKQ
ncbi:dipicolinate synthase subunit B [Amedibacillus dolichus]|uniref:Dipicolinate synthase subunit B n=3 Tax=Amedibacillus dolichus TaxID=31971 RepID=A0A942ZWA9_9FIRM|nr:dipicolinate synthase subunit B [Amedibacillus dolichus]MBS4883767.1 dipicolinate synthase subunit B [Amedibacillus dolichus]MCB5372751.1 dipicolinate synthase subunit B [Amedibacillus dolichus]MEE0383523.1 dipicolinate synthase subunit B [Amedibacillus dolichus]